MRKILYVIATAIVVAAVMSSLLLFQPPTPPPSNSYSYGFENGFDGWVSDADLPDDPNNPGQTVDWSIDIVSNVSHSGAKSAKLYVDGLQDDGTIWIERQISLTPSTTRNVTVSFEFWSESESFNTLAKVVGYVGTKNPSAESDFQVLGVANQVEGWKSYEISSAVNTDDSGNTYLAVGISVVWEAHMTYYIDDIEVTVN